MTTLTDALDIAVERLRNGEPIESIVASYPALADDIGPLLALAKLLAAPPSVSMPTSEALRADRNDFLSELALLQVQPVSTHPLSRLRDRMVHLLPTHVVDKLFARKEKWQMSTIAITLTLVITMFLGSVGGVAAIAAESLPGSPVYPVKLLMEEVNLLLAPNPDSLATQHLLLAQVRSREIQRLALAGEIPDDGILSRLELHLNLAMQHANQLDPEDQYAFLLRARETVREQEQTMTQLAEQVRDPIRNRVLETNRVWARTGQAVDDRLQRADTESSTDWS